jgi:hypothetical protein
VLGEVQDHGHVGGLAGDAGPRATGKDGHAKPVTGLHGGEHVFGVAWMDDTDRDVPVVRRVGRVHRASGVVEADRAANGALKFSPQLHACGLRLDVRA